MHCSAVLTVSNLQIAQHAAWKSSGDCMLLSPLLALAVCPPPHTCTQTHLQRGADKWNPTDVSVNTFRYRKSATKAFPMSTGQVTTSQLSDFFSNTSHLTTQKSGPSATPEHSRKPTHLILNPALSRDWTRWVHSYFRTHPSIFLNAYTAFIQQGAGNYPGQHREQTFTPLGNLGSPANPSFQVRCQLACKHSPTTHWVVRSQTGNREY